MNFLSIVPVDEIPKVIIDCPVDDLTHLYKTCLKMSFLCSKESGIGLSAAQVGIPWKLYVVNNNNVYRSFVNCSYSKFGDEIITSLEGCLSLRNMDGSLRHFKLDRFKQVQVTGKELVFDKELVLKDIDLVLDGMDAIVHQHEIDHGLGILISDPGKGEEFSLWK